MAVVRSPIVGNRGGGQIVNLAWLKEFFAAFLRARRFARHFRRLALFESWPDQSQPRSAAALAHTLIAAAQRCRGLLQAGLAYRWPERDPCRGGARARRPQRSRAREAAALVGAPVALLQEPVQPAADRAGGRVLSDRGHEGHHRDRAHGGALHAAPLLAGNQIQPGGRQAEGDGEQHRHRPAPRRSEEPHRSSSSTMRRSCTSSPRAASRCRSRCWCPAT